MVQTIKAQDSGNRAYIVLRAICIAGARVEPGTSVELPRVVGSELAAASKVALADSPAAVAAKEAAKAAKDAAKAAAKSAKVASAPAAESAESTTDTEDPK